MSTSEFLIKNFSRTLLPTLLLAMLHLNLLD
jgi:hypothetical protein